MKNPIPAALISTTLARRGTVAPDALLDCLSLVAVLDARCPGSHLTLALTDRLITLKDLRRPRTTDATGNHGRTAGPLELQPTNRQPPRFGADKARPD